MSEVNAEWLLETWAPALRSGEFHQTTNTLRLGDEYCCLGVACELRRREGALPDWEAITEPLGRSERFVGVKMISGMSKDLPSDVSAFLGCNPVGRFGRQFLAYDSAAEANDEGCSFPQIADELERIARAELTRRAAAEAAS